MNHQGFPERVGKSRGGWPGPQGSSPQMSAAGPREAFSVWGYQCLGQKPQAPRNLGFWGEGSY